MRVTPAVRKTLQAAAKSTGETFSDWARTVLLRAASDIKHDKTPASHRLHCAPREVGTR
jgi:uncharacterized protein (DUF1778 family)